MSSESGRASAFQYICARQYTLWLLFVGSTLGVSLSLLSLAVVRPGTGSSVVAVVNLLGLGPVLLFTGFFLWKCPS
jgi:hypothetical protein